MRSRVKWDEVGGLYGSQDLRTSLALVRSLHFALRAKDNIRISMGKLTRCDLCSWKVTLITVNDGLW